MDKILQVKSKINNLDSEFYTFSALYNLHIIQIKNSFTNSILKAYKDTLKDEYNIATLLNTNQVVFYYTAEKKSKTINLSLKMFHNIWKLFLKDIEQLSIQNSSNEFYLSFKDKEFTRVVIKRTSSANIYFKSIDSNSLHSRNLEFSYKPRSLEEREFLLKNSDIWLHIPLTMQSKILKNKDEIARLPKPMVLKINPFSGTFTFKIVSDLTNKIRSKSSNKIDIKIVNINEIKKVVTLKTSMFMPLPFIDYIKEYVRNNTLYEVKFAHIKQEK